MNQARCLCLVPCKEMIQSSKTIFQNKNLNILVKQGILEIAVETTKKYLNKGIKVVIARGKTYLALKEAQLDIHVIELPISVFDLLNSIEKAKLYGNKIAVVTFQSMFLGIDNLTSVLHEDIGFFCVNKEEEIEGVIKQALQEGYEVILGSALTVKSAQNLNIPFAFIESSTDSLLHAAYQAFHLIEAIEKEKYKRKLFSAIVNHVSDGIITVDKKGEILNLNPQAIKITNLKNALGKNLDTLWPEIQLREILTTQQAELHKFITYNKKEFYCNKIPIIVNSKLTSVVISFQEISKIQQLEANIRNKMYAKGHIAYFHFKDIKGESQEIKAAIKIAKQYALSDSHILITGETGTGKELFAQSIHNYSRRKNGPFVAVNCAALPNQLLESELFGYVSGAFTGANKAGKMGLFEVAHGGTIFLDEISDLDYANQGRLLRVLQEKTVVRLGSNNVLPIDVRIIAATNKNLNKAVLDKNFRDDLFYRLNVLQLQLPTLRERKKDVALYAQYFLNKYLAEKEEKKLSLKALKLLEGFDWPGNVRQLQNVMQRVAIVEKNDKVDETTIATCLDKLNIKEIDKLTYETEQILLALKQTKGKKDKAAEYLGWSRTTLWRKMKKLGL